MNVIRGSHLYLMHLRVKGLVGSSGFFFFLPCIFDVIHSHSHSPQACNSLLTLLSFMHLLFYLFILLLFYSFSRTHITIVFVFTWKLGYLHHFLLSYMYICCNGWKILKNPYLIFNFSSNFVGDFTLKCIFEMGLYFKA